MDYSALLNTLQEKSKAIGATTSRERRRKIKRLEQVVYRRRDEIRQAMDSDFGKPKLEVDYTETYVVLAEARHARRNLKSWLAPQPVATPLALFGNRSEIRVESKGVVLIITPWNFPFNLSLIPVISAVAAGNCVVLKPSENTTHSGALLKSIVEEAFPDGDVVVTLGGADDARQLTALPFDHIFFTGSTAVGQKVMQAAANNLTSVTLELGGKSPVFIDKSANLKAAAKSINWGRLMNAGQACVAPDYALVHEANMDRFISLLSTENEKYSANDQRDMARLAHDGQAVKMRQFLDDIEGKCEKILGGELDEKTNTCSPTLVINPTDDALVSRMELFGPILPIYAVKSIDDAIERINEKERPLSIYVFSKSKSNIEKLIASTRAGSTAINQTVVQFNNANLPFGGTGKSGFGRTHGLHGFMEFTNQRSVLKKVLPITTSFLVYPPYSRWKEKVAEVVMRFFG